MTKAFDEEFGEVIEKMKEYLLTNYLKMIEFTFTDKWHFKMNIPEKTFQRIVKQREMDSTLDR